jgi:hypothetical protein
MRRTDVSSSFLKVIIPSYCGESRSDYQKITIKSVNKWDPIRIVYRGLRAGTGAGRVMGLRIGTEGENGENTDRVQRLRWSVAVGKEYGQRQRNGERGWGWERGGLYLQDFANSPCRLAYCVREASARCRNPVADASFACLRRLRVAQGRYRKRDQQLLISFSISGRQDLNLRPLDPQSSTLPS